MRLGRRASRRSRTWLRRCSKASLGFSAKRELPKWRSDYFTDDRKRRDGDVVLFVDTFNRYFEPENARAALKVLEAAGLSRARAARPVLRPHLPLGRDGGRSEARGAPHGGDARSVQRQGFRSSGWSRRACSRCATSLPCCSGSDELARSAVLFEEFLARNPGKLKFRETKKQALLHGHCHQKAFDVMPAVEKVLRSVPGVEVQTVQTSCCGMAGSFGYEAEHYDVSMKMAELSPAAGGAGTLDADLLVADGTSCRHQIADGTRPRSAAMSRALLADALASVAPSPATRSAPRRRSRSPRRSRSRLPAACSAARARRRWRRAAAPRTPPRSWPRTDPPAGARRRAAPSARGCSTSLSTVVCQLAAAPARIESCETNRPMAKSAHGPGRGGEQGGEALDRQGDLHLEGHQQDRRARSARSADCGPRRRARGARRRAAG